jgi:hypothetical protein
MVVEGLDAFAFALASLIVPFILPLTSLLCLFNRANALVCCKLLPQTNMSDDHGDHSPQQSQDSAGAEKQ